MINHIVVFQFKSTLDESEIYAAVSQFANLKEVIPTIKSFSFGRNCSPEQLNKGFSHAFVMTFDDATGRDLYLEHPEHKRIAADIIIPMLEDELNSVVVIDYEI